MERECEIRRVLSALLGSTVTSIERIDGGRNNRVYKVACEGSVRYLAKRYFCHGTDARDRLLAEFGGLRFLWEQGVKHIPEPIVADRTGGWGVYEYVDGTRITSPAVAAREIAVAVGFLARLKELAGSQGSLELPLASEACFAGQTMLLNVEARLARLQAVGRQNPALRAFLQEHFRPAYDEIVPWCQSGFREHGFSWEEDLEQKGRTLSPSDFGFHNALTRHDGEIVFLDFEYFGWDDPAKMIADFLLHPAMDLDESLKRRFLTCLLNRFGDDGRLHKRVELLYPLYGLKWCLILLNEFLPEHLLRRGFAHRGSLDQRELQRQQLAKANDMLQRMMSEYGDFPYRS